MSERVPSFGERLKLSKEAWGKYCQLASGDPENPPAVFVAGFGLGMVAQAEKENEDE